MHMFIHHTYIHTYIHIYICKHTHTQTYTFFSARKHVYFQGLHIHTSIHARTHTYIHTLRHSDIFLYRCTILYTYVIHITTDQWCMKTNIITYIRICTSAAQTTKHIPRKCIHIQTVQNIFGSTFLRMYA